MKKHMIFVAEKIWALRGLLTVFCVAAVLFGVSFVSHADTVKGTITGSNVNVRETASTSATAVATLTTDDLVDVIAETTGTDNMKWYKITTESGVTGYVRSDLIKKATVTVDVTQTDSKTAYVAGSSANIRQDASTSSGRVANALGGSKVTIIGEATGADGYKWYQIEFQANGTTMKGFIRSDLVTFEAPVQEPEVTEIEGEMSENSEPESTSEPASSEEPSQSEEPSEETPAEDGKISIPLSGNEGTFVIMEPASIVENLPEGFEQTELQLGEEVFTVWGKGQFYVMYASVNDAAPQYYLYDAINKSFVAYTGLLSSADVSADKGEDGLNFKVISIVCIGIIVILAIVICILAYKLSNADDRDYDDDDDDDDDEEDTVYVDDDDDDFLDLSETANLAEVNEAVSEYMPADESAYAVYGTEEMMYETPVAESNVQYAVSEEGIYASQVQEESYAVTGDTRVYAPVEQPVYEETAENYAVYAEENEEAELFEDEEEEPRKSRKDKKAKKEKKSFSQRFLDYFTVEVEDDDDDDDDDDDYEVRGKGRKKSVAKPFAEDDDDDDDLNFIDL